MQSDFTIHQLRLFLGVARFGSFSKAAVAFNLPQSAVSRAVSRIETTVGVSLFGRSGTGVTLTPAGKRFHFHAETAVYHHDLAFSEMQEMRGGLFGETRIATPESVADILFVPLIKYFREHHPAASIRAVAAQSAAIPTLMENGMIDIGIMADTHARPSTPIEPLCQEAFYLVGPKGAPETAKENITLSQCADLPLILNAMEGGFRALIDRSFSSIGRVPNLQIEIDANDPLLDLILAGEGFSIMPYSIMAHKHQLTHLSASRIEEPEISRKLLMTIAAGRATSPVCREAARQIRKIMEENAGAARWIWNG